MNTKFLKVVFFAITFLYLISFVSADFAYVLGDEALSACRCSVLDDSIKIKNTGSEVTAYNIASNRNYVDISPSQFSLNPGQTIDVALAINTPCDSFTKNIKLTVTSDKGDDTTLVKQLTSGQCQNLKSNVFASTSETGPCQAVDYRLLINNAGPFTETYAITSTHDAFINYSNSTVEINPGEVEQVDAVLTLPCGQYGEDAVTFTIEAVNNNLQTVTTHNLNVIQFYDYSVDVDSEIQLCEEETNSVPFIISNDAGVTNTFYLDLDGAPPFIRLSERNVTLAAGEEAEVEIMLLIGEGKGLGRHDFVLKSSSELGDQSQEVNVSIELSNCYEFSVAFQSDTNEFCHGEIGIPFKVRNDGASKETFVFSVDPDFAYLGASRASLDAGEELDNMVVFGSEDKDEFYSFTATATLLENNLTASDTFNFEVVSRGTCHYVDIGSNYYSIVRDLENEAYVTITNRGRSEETYVLSLEPESFVTLSQDSVVLAPGQSHVITLHSNHSWENELGDYEFELLIMLNDLQYTHQITLNLADKPVYLKLYEHFSTRPCQLATLLLSLLVLLSFLAFVNAKKKRGNRRASFHNLAITFLLVMVVLAGLIFNFHGYPLLNDPIPQSTYDHYYWAQDTDLVLSISDVVADPDMEDEVEISLQEENIRISMEATEDSLIFTPEAAWTGKKQIVLVATDSKGASTESHTIYLEVVERRDYSLYQAYEKLCWWFNWLLLLVSLFFFLLYASKRLRGPKQ